MSEHIADKATLVAALAADDAERRRAEQHAASCPPCRAALAEGTRLVDLLREALPAPAPAPEALARAARDLEQESAAERRRWWRMGWISGGAIALAWVFQLMVGTGFDVDLRCIGVSLAILAVAIASVTVLRGRERLAVAGMVATSAAFALATGTASGLEATLGVRCSFRELWAAAISWAIITTAARASRLSLGRWQQTAVATAGALAAHAGQHVACEVPHSDLHLLVFHVGPLLLAAGLAAASASRQRPALA